MMIGKYLAAVAIAAACLVSGCASVNRASHGSSEQAKHFVPVTDKAVVYIYRDEILGSAIKMPVLVDGVLAGETGPKSFLQLGVTPGKHTIQSVAEKNASIQIDALAGHNYYVWQEVKMGVMVARSALHVVDEHAGKAGVAKCDLLVTLSPQFRLPADGAPVPMAPPPTAASPVPPAEVSSPQVAAPPTNVPVSQAAPVSVAATHATIQPEGGPAVLDSRIDKPMFQAAQDLASRHQCERLLRIRSVDGDTAHFYSNCAGSQTPIEILCNGASCHEGAPQG